MTASHIPSDGTAPSTPPTRLHRDNAIFSDTAHPTSPGTPPSSPPVFPWELQQERVTLDTAEQSTISTKADMVRNVFSVLGKRKPLATSSDNIRPKKQQKPASSKPLTQMQMSLGQKIQTKCKACGMEYVASSAEDRKLHDKFHKQSTEGCDVGKSFVSSTHRAQQFRGVKSVDTIVELDCFDHGRRRNIGQVALEVVQRELGAVPIPREEVWDAERQSTEGKTRYRSYLYIRGTKCIGYLLAEHIKEAYRTVRPATAAPEDASSRPNTSCTPKNALEALRARKRAAEQAQRAAEQEIEDAADHPMQLSKTKYPAVLGVSRIWTSSTHRGQGIATCLLDTAIKRCNAKFELDRAAIKTVHEEIATREGAQAKIPATRISHRSPKVERKEQVAFSQPTDSGARLARKWFGKAYGWSVYID